MEVPINYLAVLVSAVAAIVLGALWYGPLFGKAWMKEVGYTNDDVQKAKTDPKTKSAMMRSYVLMAVGALVMAFVFAHSLAFANYYLDTSGVGAGLTGAFWNWLGFIAPVTLAPMLWEGKSAKYWAITGGYYFVSLGVMGIILGLWV
ncbi:MAG: DUF1761 domain-containing protein [Patescibacteria group bacterium]